MRARRMIAIVTVASCLATPAVAGAARVWQPALAITPRGAQPGDPAAAAGTGGEGLAAFTVERAGRAQVEARVRVPDVRAPWARLVLSGTFPLRPPPPVAAIEPGGRAFVAWRVPGGGVRAAVRDRPRGAWRVVPVAAGGATDDEFRSFTGAAAAMQGGTVLSTLAWAERTGGAWTVRVARRTGTGAGWGESPRLPLPAGADGPSVAVAADGTVTAAWPIPATPAPFAAGGIQAAVATPDGGWTPTVTLSADGLLPSAAATSGGRAAVAWEDHGGPVPTVTVAEAGAGTTWGAPRPVAPGQAPRIAGNPSGDLAMTWAGPGTADATPILAAVRPALGAWPAPATLTAGVGLTRIEASLARVAIGGTGRAFVGVLDQEGPGSATVVLGAARAGEGWSIAGQPVGGDEFGVAISASADGNGLAVLPTYDPLLARDFDPYGRPVVTAGLAGARRGGGTVAWTAVVRNRGRFTARSVTLRLGVCCGTRLLSAHPAGVRSGPQVTWTFPHLAPGRSLTIRLTLRHPHPGPVPRLSGTVDAVARPPTFVTATARG
jgi:hypothetical protein